MSEISRKTTKITRSKPPAVRMTKTAQMRLLKANPLIKYEVEKTNNKEMLKNLNLDSVSALRESVFEKSLMKNASSVQEKPKLPKKINYNNLTKKLPIKSTLRRSTSAPRLPQQKHDKVETSQNLPNKSISTEDISSQHSKEIFKTPFDRKYSVYTQVSGSRKSLYCSTPSAPLDLKRRLTEWLDRKNLSSTSFKHLKCFGVHKIDLIREENKENVNTSNINEHGSYENLDIEPSYNNLRFEETSLILAPSDLSRISKAAIKDLHLLITEGYPKEQCEAWLLLIRNKCPEVIEDPEYWECKASVAQLDGDFGSAVECYKTAVVQGAEISSIEQSLDQLMQKFKLLEVDSEVKQQTQPNRTKVIRDFKNVFTSTIIKFALQEKNLKKKNDNLKPLIITPVRRSTRLNRSGYTSTPGMRICASMDEFDVEHNENMMFKPNAALNV